MTASTLTRFEPSESVANIPARIGVTGGRYYDDNDTVASVLAEQPESATLVHGGARGADTLCSVWWRMHGRHTEIHPASWSRYGKQAGFIRNQEMVNSGLDLLIVFPGGAGTADMRRRAIQAGIPIYHVSTLDQVLEFRTDQPSSSREDWTPGPLPAAGATSHYVDGQPLPPTS